MRVGITFLVLVVIAVILVVVFGVGALVGSRRMPGEVVKETPKADLLGPGGPDDPDAGA